VTLGQRAAAARSITAVSTSSKVVLRELKRLGTVQNAKIYRRQGAGEDVYGVSFAKLRPLAKKLAPDHALARKSA